MGLTAIVSTSASSSSAGVEASITSGLSPIGLGVGGLFVALALIFALAYLNILESIDADRTTRNVVIASVVPMLFVFGAMVLYESLQVLG